MDDLAALEVLIVTIAAKCTYDERLIISERLIMIAEIIIATEDADIQSRLEQFIQDQKTNEQ